MPWAVHEPPLREYVVGSGMHHGRGPWKEGCGTNVSVEGDFRTEGDVPPGRLYSVPDSCAAPRSFSRNFLIDV